MDSFSLLLPLPLSFSPAPSTCETDSLAKLTSVLNKIDLGFPMLPLPLKCWNYIPHPLYPVHAVLGSEPQS